MFGDKKSGLKKWFTAAVLGLGIAMAEEPSNALAADREVGISFQSLSSMGMPGITLQNASRSFIVNGRAAYNGTLQTYVLPGTQVELLGKDYNPTTGNWPNSLNGQIACSQGNPDKRPAKVGDDLVFDNSASLVCSGLGVGPNGAGAAFLVVRLRDDKPDLTLQSNFNILVTDGRYENRKLVLQQRSDSLLDSNNASHGKGGDPTKDVPIPADGMSSLTAHLMPYAQTASEPPNVSTVLNGRRVYKTTSANMANVQNPGTIGPIVIGGDHSAGGGLTTRDSLMVLGGFAFSNAILADWQVALEEARLRVLNGETANFELLEIFDPTYPHTPAEIAACDARYPDCLSLTPQENAANCAAQGVTGTNMICSPVTIPSGIANTGLGSVSVKAKNTAGYSGSSNNANLPAPIGP